MAALSSTIKAIRRQRRRKASGIIQSLAALGAGFLQGREQRAKAEALALEKKRDMEREDLRDKLAVLSADRAERGFDRAEDWHDETVAYRMAEADRRERERAADIAHRTGRESVSDAFRREAMDLSRARLELSRAHAASPAKKTKFDEEKAKWIDWLTSRSPEEFPVQSFVSILRLGLEDTRVDDEDAPLKAVQVLRRSPTDSGYDGGIGMPSDIATDPDVMRAYDYFIGRYQDQFFRESKKDGTYLGLPSDFWTMPPIFEESVTGVESEPTDELYDLEALEE